MFSFFLSHALSATIKDHNFWEPLERKEFVFENNDFVINVQIPKNPFYVLFASSDGYRAIAYSTVGDSYGNLVKDTNGNKNDYYLVGYNTTRGFVAIKPSGKFNKTLIYYGIDMYSTDPQNKCKSISVLSNETVILNQEPLSFENETRCLWLVAPNTTTFNFNNPNKADATVYSSQGPSRTTISSLYDPIEAHINETYSVNASNLFIKWTPSEHPITITRKHIEPPENFIDIDMRINPTNIRDVSRFENGEYQGDNDPFPTPLPTASPFITTAYTEEETVDPTSGLTGGGIFGIVIGCISVVLGIAGAVIKICC